MSEIRRFWVRNFKSLRDVEFGFPTKLTVVVGAQRLRQDGIL